MGLRVRVCIQFSVVVAPWIVVVVGGDGGGGPGAREGEGEG